MKRLREASCSLCAQPLLTLGEQPLCKECIKDECCMSDQLDSYDRVSCNTLLPLKRRIENGEQRSYCIGHWKKRTETCKMCPSKCILKAYDDWNYCKKHLPDQEDRDQLVMNLLSNKTNLDVAQLVKARL